MAERVPHCWPNALSTGGPETAAFSLREHISTTEIPATSGKGIRCAAMSAHRSIYICGEGKCALSETKNSLLTENLNFLAEGQLSALSWLATKHSEWSDTMQASACPARLLAPCETFTEI